VSTHPYAVGDRVIINPDLARACELGIVWTVTRHLKVNDVIERVDGTGRPMRINPLDLRHAPADAPATNPAATAEVTPYQAPLYPGTLVTITGPRWTKPADTLYMVLRDQGDRRVSCVQLGGDNGRYWRVGRSMITVVDPARVRLQPTDATP
jgi:hypothetical protein